MPFLDIAQHFNEIMGNYFDVSVDGCLGQQRNVILTFICGIISLDGFPQRYIAIITVKDVDYRIILFMILKNLKQLIYQKILCLNIVAIYKKCISKKSLLKVESTTIILRSQSKQKKQRLKTLIDEKNCSKDFDDLFYQICSQKPNKMNYNELMGKN